jgi:undecaprenyl-diphosphatase
MSKSTAGQQTTIGVFSQMRDILRDAWGFACKWKWFYIAALVVFTPAVLFMMHRDAQLLPHFRFVDNQSASKFAKFMQETGKTTGTTLVLYVVLFSIGLWRRKEKLTRVALCMMLAVVVSGVSLYIVRVSFGRARPCMKEAGQFTYFAVRPEYNSFPSAHCSEAWALATVISASYPPTAVPACAYAGTMMWARMQRNQHFPSDVVAGTLLGIAFALPFAFVAIGKKPDVRKRDSQSLQNAS